MTGRMETVLGHVRQATRDSRWYRAASSGERVTLASLYRHGYIIRRCHRGEEGEPDAAHEYALHGGPYVRQEERGSVRCEHCVEMHDGRAKRRCGAAGCDCYCNRSGAP